MLHKINTIPCNFLYLFLLSVQCNAWGSDLSIHDRLRLDMMQRDIEHQRLQMIGSSMQSLTPEVPPVDTKHQAFLRNLHEENRMLNGRKRRAEDEEKDITELSAVLQYNRITKEMAEDINNLNLEFSTQGLYETLKNPDIMFAYAGIKGRTVKRDKKYFSNQFLKEVVEKANKYASITDDEIKAIYEKVSEKVE